MARQFYLKHCFDSGETSHDKYHTHVNCPIFVRGYVPMPVSVEAIKNVPKCNWCNDKDGLKEIGLPLWCIYFDTTDFPKKYIARKFINSMPTDAFLLADTLNQIRETLPSGLVRLERNEFDDPVIVETWF